MPSRKAATPATRPTSRKTVATAPKAKPAPATRGVALDVRDDESVSAGTLVSEGVKLLDSYLRLKDKEQAALKKLAVIVVKLRARYTDSQGRPDMLGRSLAYREAVHKIYERAGVPADAVSSLQSTLRYHISDTLRAYLYAHGMEPRDYGLHDESKRERMVAGTKKVRQSATTMERPALAERDDPAPALAAAVAELAVRARETAKDVELVQAAALLTGQQRDALDADLEAIDELVALIRASM